MVINLNKLIDDLGYLTEKLEFSHYKCDINSDLECYAEQYGDGDVYEHEKIRELNSTLSHLKDAMICSCMGTNLELSENCHRCGKIRFVVSRCNLNPENDLQISVF